MLLGNLSTDVFEPRTSTGSCIFHSLERFDAIAFITSNRRHENKSFPIHGKEQNHAKKENIRLPVAVRGSKTSVLKFKRDTGSEFVGSDQRRTFPQNALRGWLLASVCEQNGSRALSCSPAIFGLFSQVRISAQRTASEISFEFWNNLIFHRRFD